jgi:hypothetical protein
MELSRSVKRLVPLRNNVLYQISLSTVHPTVHKNMPTCTPMAKWPSSPLLAFSWDSQKEVDRLLTQFNNVQRSLENFYEKDTRAFQFYNTSQKNTKIENNQC